MLGSAASVGRSLVLLAALASSLVHGAPPSCQVAVGTAKFDLSALSAVRTVELTRQTPPTETTDRVRMILCGGDDGGLPREDGVAEQDQCPANTYVCLQVQNKKADANPPVRTVSVLPIVADAKEGPALTAEWTTAVGDVASSPTPVPVLVGNLTGGTWSSGPQRLTIRLACVGPDDSEDDPVLRSYADNTLSLSWNTQHACALGGDGRGDNDDDEHPGVGDGGGGGRGFFSWLFILCAVLLALLDVLIFAAIFLLVPPIYLALGIYHNRTTYDAQGWDAVPNREFWQELPANLRDLAGHVLGGVRRRGGGSGGGSSRQGYESLDAA